MDKLEEIGIDRMREHLRAACSRRFREKFFHQVLREESDAINPQAIHSMQSRLHAVCAPGLEDSLLRQVVRKLTDPLKPTNERGKWRTPPLLVLLGGTALLALRCVFYWKRASS